MLASKGLMASSAVEPIFVDDVFSTYLYTGNGSTQTITNGIDLAGEGGLVWQKIRSSTGSHILVDTARGAGNFLNSNSTSAQTFNASVVSSFNSDGFTDGGSQINGATYASWTFRKAPKFFDVVTYTGDGVAGKTIAHNLGSVPGMIIVKRTSTTGSWYVYHRSLGNGAYQLLNSTDAAITGAVWNNTSPTSTVFSIGGDLSGVNTSGATYVAYLFAHDAGGFGDSGTDNIVSCGSFTTDGSGNVPTVSLGWEPQLLFFKASSVPANWSIWDTMRGFSQTDNLNLSPNTSSAENSFGSVITPTATGFSAGSAAGFNPGTTVIYLAIRRPNKPPTIGTEVFSPNATTNDTILTTTGFPVDLFVESKRGSTGDKYFGTRLLGGFTLTSNTTNQNAETISVSAFQSNVGVRPSLFGAVNSILWSFRRAPGFFDVVCYTGTGDTRTVAHNLTTVPELMIIKARSSISGTSNWTVYSSATGPTGSLLLNTTAAFSTDSGDYNNTAPTDSVFTVRFNITVNALDATYVAYLFATVPNVSKVGSYTGTGTTQQINCGFTTGARFVLIKRTDSTGNWYVWDTARGIIAGDDPYLLLNTTAAEVTNTDYVDPLASGFEISSTAPAEINASGGSYIFLAIA